MNYESADHRLRIKLECQARNRFFREELQKLPTDEDIMVAYFSRFFKFEVFYDSSLCQNFLREFRRKVPFLFFVRYILGKSACDIGALNFELN